MPTTSAVVIGGSLSGMCAARVLSDFVDTITIVEHDGYPSAQEFRPRVPQARHVHSLLARGLREFEGFFPGFDRQMRKCGAVAVETGWDVATAEWVESAQPHGTMAIVCEQATYRIDRSRALPRSAQRTLSGAH